MPIRFDDASQVYPVRDEESIGVSNDETIRLLSRFVRVGTWKLDIDNSSYEISRTSCAIFGVDYNGGRASLLSVRQRIHPDDMDLVAEAFFAASERKCNFSVIYRVMSEGRPKFVQSLGAYRAVEGTSGELYGITYEMLDHVRELVFDTED